MKALNAVILCKLIQFPTVAIPVNVYMYKELSAINSINNVLKSSVLT